jgi:hypothetical protein
MARLASVMSLTSIVSQHGLLRCRHASVRVLWMLYMLVVVVVLLLAQVNGSVDVFSSEDLLCCETVVGLTQDAEVFAGARAPACTRVDVVDLEKAASRAAPSLGVDEATLLAVTGEHFAARRA